LELVMIGSGAAIPIGAPIAPLPQRCEGSAPRRPHGFERGQRQSGPLQLMGKRASTTVRRLRIAAIKLLKRDCAARIGLALCETGTAGLCSCANG
jgi:hypothetical protein